MRRAREFKQGECEICSQETELQRPVNSFDAWCCSPCLIRMRDRAAARARKDNLWGGIFK